MTTPSRLGWFSSANITCVAKIWSSSLTTVQPMSTGTELPSASLDRAERLTGTPSLCSSVLGTAVKVDTGVHSHLEVLELRALLVSDTYGYNQFSHCGLSLKSSQVPLRVLTVLLLVIETDGPPVADPQLTLSVGA